jgi:hypothetical protein
MATTDDRRLAWEEAWEGWLRPVVLLLGAGLFVLAWQLAWIPEVAAATVLGMTLVLVGLGLNTLHAGQAARRSRVRPALLAVGAVATVLAGALMWLALVPGDPDATAQLEAPGDMAALGSVPGGRLVVEATPRPGVRAEGQQVRFGLSLDGKAGHQGVHESFRLADARPHGPRQGGSQPEFLAATFELSPLGAEARARLTSLDPSDLARIDLRVYAHPFPLAWMGGTLVVLALGAAWLESRLTGPKAKTYLTVGIVTAAAFAFAAKSGIAPRSAVTALFGRMLLAAVVGGITGAILPWLLRVLVPPRAAAPLGPGTGLKA